MRISGIRILSLIVGGSIGAALLIYVSHLDAGFASRESVATEVSTFRFAPIQRGSFEQTTTVTGTLKPVETVEVGSQLSGQIANLYVDFNDKVRAGDPLAQIDPRTFQAKVDEARASLNTALANIRVEEAKLDRARFDLKNARANKAVLDAKLESAHALKALAERNVDRKLALRSHDATPVTALDDAQTDLVTKFAIEREAETLVSVNGIQVEGAAADVRRLEAELEQAKAVVPEKEAMLRAAEADLDRTVIRSPINGVVVGRFVNKGQTLAVGLEARTAFDVAHNLEDMEIHARVDETDIGRIVPGQQAHFTVDAFPDRQFEAFVRQIRKAPQVNQNVVTYTVVLTTANPDGILLPGMTALVHIITDREDNVLKAPVAALRFLPAGSRRVAGATSSAQSVWVRSRDGELRQVSVTVGRASADQVVLKSGSLNEGDEVAVGQAIAPSGRELFGIRFGS
jgi:HlyD family secretion protein